MLVPILYAAALLPAAPTAGHMDVRVYSELRRIGPDGAPVEADSIGRPREIL